MKDFLHKFGRRVMGVLSGFDRILFRGTLRCVVDAYGMNGHLYGAGVAMKDFKQYTLQVTKNLIEQSLQQAHQIGCEIRYLESSRESKKQIALQIAERDGRTDGLICVLRCVEPCQTFKIKRDRRTRKIALEKRPSRCLHLYHYYDHPQYGLMHVRLQTYFPFMIQVCMNGREWLIKQLRQAGLAYQRRDNCVCLVEDVDAAQRLLDAQLHSSWRDLLNDLRRQVHPAHEAIFAACPVGASDYYWTAPETEWASDILFRDPREVLPLCERMAAYTLRVHGVADVMRFLGRTVRQDGMPRAHFGGEIASDGLVFEQGVRIKHRVNANQVKLYNRPGVLRLETTIHRPEEFKVWRTTERDPDGPMQWLKLRRGVADLHRRAQVSQASNGRFAAALGAVLDEDQVPLKQLAAKLCSPVVRPAREQPDGRRTRPRRFRALNPLNPQDIRLLSTVSQTEFVLNGLRNADVRRALYGEDPADAKERRRRSSAVSRQLALLRAHGILQKVPQSHHYRVTKKGRKAVTALLAAANATTSELTKLAA